MRVSLEEPDLSAEAPVGGSGEFPIQKVRVFGEYELLEEIDHGGMGVVFKARQKRLNRVVALKMILGGPYASKDFIQRFKTEAQAVATLQHPNIVAIHDVGEFEGHHYFSMDYVEGQNLAQLVRDRPLPAPRAAAYVQSIAEAIHYAHQRGILHRDLKPSNVLIDQFDQPRVTDFGLAKRIIVPGTGGAASGPEASWVRAANLTESGQVLGTPNYMPPEQAGGKRGEIGPHSDVYSLGAILYFLLTARPPIVAKTLEETLNQLRSADVPSPRLLNASIPRELETICLKCLNREPHRRYHSAKSLAEDIGHWLRHEPISARPPTRREKILNLARRNPVRFGLLAIALLGVLLTGAFFYGSYRTYVFLMEKIADEHLVVPPEDDGVYVLHVLGQGNASRCSYNFWKHPFRWNGGRYVRLEITNVPAPVANTLQVEVWGDVPAYPDIRRTRALTNGQIFFLPTGQYRERAFYFAGVNFLSSNLLERFPNATLRVILLGRRTDADPFMPAGALAPDERP